MKRHDMRWQALQTLQAMMSSAMHTLLNIVDMHLGFGHWHASCNPKPQTVCALGSSCYPTHQVFSGGLCGFEGAAEGVVARGVGTLAAGLGLGVGGLAGAGCFTQNHTRVIHNMYMLSAIHRIHATRK